MENTNVHLHVNLPMVRLLRIGCTPQEIILGNRAVYKAKKSVNGKILEYFGMQNKVKN